MRNSLEKLGHFRFRLAFRLWRGDRDACGFRRKHIRNAPIRIRCRLSRFGKCRLSRIGKCSGDIKETHTRPWTERRSPHGPTSTSCRTWMRNQIWTRIRTEIRTVARNGIRNGSRNGKRNGHESWRVTRD